MTRNVGASVVAGSINRTVRYLVQHGLADDQNTAFRRPGTGGRQEVVFQGVDSLWLALKKREYSETYARLLAERAYNVRMADGALIQMAYEFQGRRLLKHRLAYLPSVRSDPFQQNPEVYLADETFGDVAAALAVSIPLRFDFHASDERHQVLDHPKCHLTLGDWPECRIPVSAPVPPVIFVDFLLRSFYDTRAMRWSERLPREGLRFEPSIHDRERGVLHVVVPS